MFTEYDKMSKKAKKEHNAKKRGIWDINPITRVNGKSKGYDRNAEKRSIRPQIAV